jgi:pyocin large subunit-like protein
VIEALRMALADVAAPWAVNQYAIELAINRGCRLRAAVAVYIAITADGHVDYIGSTARMSNRALHDRIREHVSDQRRSDLWVRLIAIKLRADTPTREARRIEGEVGRLLKPLSNRRLPRTRLAS